MQRSLADFVPFFTGYKHKTETENFAITKRKTQKNFRARERGQAAVYPLRFVANLDFGLKTVYYI